jgi:haloacetate dehalogenase
MSGLAPGRFARFASRRIAVDGATIHCRIGGSGPPLLLLHGCPQSHLMWHKIADELAGRFTVVAADLRGYGDSSKPPGTPRHDNYSFRVMAADQIETMAALGFRRFMAVGHDRGARVLHRMALDHPQALSRIALLDILPTSILYGSADRTFASAYWEWFFFTQAADFPEEVLSANPAAFLRHELGTLLDTGIIPPDVWDEYLRVISGKTAMHGMCEDYRAGASIDLEHDAADAQRQLACPVMILWGDRNPIWARFDMLDVWRRFASIVEGGPLPAGHYIAEEVPEELLSRLQPFLDGG